jgi:DNA-binding NarL/FixJ family response regulator
MSTLLNTVSDFEVIGYSLDGSSLYDDVTNSKANILILDISMPKKDGIAVIKSLLKDIPVK